MSHDPTAESIAAKMLVSFSELWGDDYDTAEVMYADMAQFMSLMAARDLAVVRVGEVPPWMRLVERDAQQFGHDLYIMRDES